MDTHNRYQNGKIYRLFGEDGYYYYGSTTDELRKRLCNHKANGKRYNSPVYSHYNNLGWDKVKIVLVENYACKSKQELLMKETEYIENAIDDIRCLNVRHSIIDPEIKRQQKIIRRVELWREKSQREKMLRSNIKDAITEGNEGRAPAAPQGEQCS